MNPNDVLLELLAACAEGDPSAARECALDLAKACSERHAPNIVCDSKLGRALDHIAYVVSEDLPDPEAEERAGRVTTAEMADRTG